MEAKKNKKELRKQLKPSLLENCINNKVLKKVKADLLKVGILGGSVQDIFNQRIAIEQISDDVLYHLSKSMYEILDREVINPKRYFTGEEIEEIKRLKRTKLSEEEKKLPIIFQRATKVAHDHYVVFISAKKVANLYHRGSIRYRKETQRQATVYKKGGTLIQTPTIDHKSVKQIKEKLLQGKFITNYITLNSIEEEDLEYDEKAGILKVNNILDILDGFHRSMGMVEAVAEGDINYITGVNITNYNVEKAHRFIVQEDKKNKMARRFIKYLDKESKANIVVKKINENDYSDLNGKIVTDRKLIRYGKALTLTDIMEIGIKRYFDLKTMSDVKNLAEYLVEGFNHIIGLFPQYFIENVKINKKNNIMAHENTFIGYLYILSKVRGIGYWKDELDCILKEIDFSKNNLKWEEIGIMKLEILQSTIDKLEEYLDEFV